MRSAASGYNRFLIIIAVLGMTGCASYIGERIVRAPNIDRPNGIFGKEMDAAWESDVAKHFLVERTRIRAPADDVELKVSVLPAGNYPSRASIEQEDGSIELGLQAGMPVGPPRGPPKGTVVTVHGWKGESRAMLFHAMEMAAHGWDVVLYDQRGHGQSGGERITFGMREARDLEAVMAWTRSRPEYSPPLILFGTSMGASTALMAAAESDPHAIVAVAPYARVDQVLPRALRRFSPVLLQPFLTDRRMRRALAHAESLSGVDFDDDAPIRSAAEVDAPVLLVYSRTDRLIPPEHGRELERALPNARLHWMADHSHEALMVDRDAVLPAVLPWLDATLTETAASGQSPGNDPGEK